MTRSSRNFPVISLENQNNEELVDNIVNDKYELARIRRETFPSIKQLYTTKKEQNSFVRVCAPMVRYRLRSTICLMSKVIQSKPIF